MKTYTAIEYIAIDIANQFGLDKLNYEVRIQWVRDHQDQLLELIDQAEEPELYFKAVTAFNKALQGLPTGHPVAFDTACSGLQIMSVLTGCKSGCEMTGLIDPDNRKDAYSIVTQVMNQQLKNKITVIRKDAKRAVMTALYGSIAQPAQIFGYKTPAFYTFFDVLKHKACGAYWLLQELKALWDSSAYAHSWYMPDGHYVHVPVMTAKTHRVGISELDYTMSVEIWENTPQPEGISIPANLIHSVDAFVLRTLVRRCNYNDKEVKQALAFIDAELTERQENGYTFDYVDSYINVCIDAYARTQMIDTSIIQSLNAVNINQMSTTHLEKLQHTLKCMYKYEPFEVITVHDSFACHPNHMNQLRYWYKEILAELAEATVLQDLLTQLCKEPIHFKPMGTVAPYIRESNYGIC